MKNFTENFNKSAGAMVSRIGSALMNPDTLTGIAAVLVPTTVGFAIWGTCKACKESENFTEDDDFFSKARKVYKYYIPTVISGTMCVVCIIASNKVGAKERVALATALAMSEEALKKEQQKLEEATGTKTKVNVEKTEKTKNTFKSGTDREDYGDPDLESLPKEEKCWCRDQVTGNMFKTTKTALDMANGRIKQRISERWHGSEKSLYTINEMYEMLGVAGCELGNDYFISDGGDEYPMIITGDVTQNGEFFFKLDYCTVSDYDDSRW